MGRVLGLGAGVVMLDFKGTQYRAKLPPNCHPRVGQEMAFYLCQEQAYANCPDKFKRMMPPTAEEQITLAFPRGTPIYPEIPTTNRGNFSDVTEYDQPYLGTRSAVDPFYYFIAAYPFDYSATGGIYAGRAQLEPFYSRYQEPSEIFLPFSGYLGLMTWPLPYRSDPPAAATAVLAYPRILGLDLNALLRRYSQSGSAQQLITEAIKLMTDEKMYITAYVVSISKTPFPEKPDEYFGTVTRSTVTTTRETTEDPLAGDENTLGHDVRNMPPLGVGDVINIDIETETTTYQIKTERQTYPLAVINQRLKIQPYSEYRLAYGDIAGDAAVGIPETLEGALRTTDPLLVSQEERFYLQNFEAELGEDSTSFRYQIGKYSIQNIPCEVYSYSINWQRDEDTGLGWVDFSFVFTRPDTIIELEQRSAFTERIAYKHWASDNPDEYSVRTTEYSELKLGDLFYRYSNADFLQYQFEQAKTAKDIDRPTYLMSAMAGSGPIATEIGPDDDRNFDLLRDIRNRSYLVSDPDLPDRVGVGSPFVSEVDTRDGERNEFYGLRPELGTIFGYPGTCTLMFDGWVTDEDGSRRYMKRWAGSIFPYGLTSRPERVEKFIFVGPVDAKPLYKGKFGTIIRTLESTEPPEGQPPYKLLDIEIPVSESEQHAEILIRYRDVIYAAVFTIEGPEGAKQPYVRMQRKKIGFKPGEEKSESAWYPRILDYWEGNLRQLMQNQFIAWNDETLWNSVDRIFTPNPVLKSDNWPQATGYINFYTKDKHDGIVTFRPTLPLDYPERHPDIPLVVDSKGNPIRQDIPPLTAVSINLGSFPVFEPMWVTDWEQP